MKLRLETEILRKMKDKRIQELEESLNKLRATLENKINLQQTTIEQLEITKLDQASKILALEEWLAQKHDIQKQLDEALYRE
jgi:hypothetical protein